MDNNIKQRIIGCLHKVMEDGPRTSFSKKYLVGISRGDVVTLNACLQEWQGKDYLQIIKPLDDCQDDEICIEMKSFIEQKSPIRGFLNWQ